MRLFSTVSFTKTFKICFSFLNQVPIALSTYLGCKCGDTVWSQIPTHLPAPFLLPPAPHGTYCTRQWPESWDSLWFRKQSYPQTSSTDKASAAASVTGGGNWPPVSHPVHRVSHLLLYKTQLRTCQDKKEGSEHPKTEVASVGSRILEKSRCEERRD